MYPSPKKFRILDGEESSETHMDVLYLKQCIKFVIVVQLLSVFMTPWTVAHQAPLSFTVFQSLFKFMSIELVMPSNCLILCRPLLLLPSIFPSIGVFSRELAPLIRWPKYQSFSFSISPSSEYSGPLSIIRTILLLKMC